MPVSHGLDCRVRERTHAFEIRCYRRQRTFRTRIRFARVSSHVDDFNTRNKVLTAKLLRQGYRYHKLRKAFSKFYRRHFDIVSKYNVGLKTLLLQGLSEPEFYGDLVYKFRKIICKMIFLIISKR